MICQICLICGCIWRKNALGSGFWLPDFETNLCRPFHNVHVCVYTYIYIYTYIYVYITCVYIYIYIYFTCVCIYIFIYIYISYCYWPLRSIYTCCMPWFYESKLLFLRINWLLSVQCVQFYTHLPCVERTCNLGRIPNLLCFAFYTLHIPILKCPCFLI